LFTDPIEAKVPPATHFQQCIEDCVIYLGNADHRANWEWPAVHVHSFDAPIVNSLAKQLDAGNAFTEKQSHIGLRLVKKYASKLRDAGFDADKILVGKVFGKPFRVIDKTKSLYIDGDDIVCKSNFIPDLVNNLKKHAKKPGSGGQYNADNKSWSFSYTEDNIVFLYSVTKGKNFTIEDKIKNDFENIRKIKESAFDYYPMVTMEQGKYVVKNSPSDQIKLVSTDAREVMFEARRYGISIFDDCVIDNISSPTAFDKILYGSHDVWTTDGKGTYEDLMDLIKSAKQTVIMVSSHMPPQLRQWMAVLQNAGVETSVSFRFKKEPETNKEIKDRGMNVYNPNAKVLITNEKISKKFVSDNIQPDLVICNLNTQPSHFKTGIWLDSKPMVVYNCTEKQMRDKTYGVL